MTPSTPIFDFHDTFDATVQIGRVEQDDQVLNEGTPLPIHIKRFSKTEMEAFEKSYAALQDPRGTATPEPGAAEKLDAARLAFFDTAIRDAITIDEGLVRDRSKWVVDGAGLLAVFHARKDVLGSLVAAIIVENRLMGVLGKNSNSPRASGTGSAPSTQARGGDRPEPTAGSVDSSSTASPGVVTAENSETDEDVPASSGVSDEATKVH